MARVYRRPAARRDLIAHYVHLADNASVAVADRFLRQAEVSFDELLAQPAIGAPLTLCRLELGGLRKWRVRDFDSYLIFYFERPDGVSIVRVLHAARDWWRLLGVEA